MVRNSDGDLTVGSGPDRGPVVESVDSPSAGCLQGMVAPAQQLQVLGISRAGGRPVAPMVDVGVVRAGAARELAGPLRCSDGGGEKVAGDATPPVEMQHLTV